MSRKIYSIKHSYKLTQDGSNISMRNLNIQAKPLQGSDSCGSAAKKLNSNCFQTWVAVILNFYLIINPVSKDKLPVLPSVSFNICNCFSSVKQEVLEHCAQSKNYDIIGITETQWDNSQDWRVTMDGYRLFSEDRQGRRVIIVMLYVKEKLECIEINYGNCWL